MFIILHIMKVYDRMNDMLMVLYWAFKCKVYLTSGRGEKIIRDYLQSGVKADILSWW